MTPATARELTRIIGTWVAREPSCRALALIGSWARGGATPASDLDLIVLATSPEAWTGSLDWLSRTGLTAAGYWVRAAERAAYGRALSWHIEFEGGALLELTFADLSWADRDPIDPGTRSVVADGMLVVADKDGLLTALQQQIARENGGGGFTAGDSP